MRHVEEADAIREPLDRIVVEEVTLKVFGIVYQQVSYETRAGPKNAASDQVVSRLRIVHQVVLAYKVLFGVVDHAGAELLFQLLLPQEIRAKLGDFSGLINTIVRCHLK